MRVKSYLKKINNAHFTQLAPDAWAMIEKTAESFELASAVPADDIQAIKKHWSIMEDGLDSGDFNKCFNGAVDFVELRQRLAGFLESFAGAEATDDAEGDRSS